MKDGMSEWFITDKLINNVEKAIGDIPANNTGIISFRSKVLRDFIERDLLREIAKRAVKTIASECPMDEGKAE